MHLIPKAPLVYKGTLQDLFDQHISKVMLDESSVYQFHSQLVNYINTADPVFFIRTIKGLDREIIFRNRQGFQIQPTDNSPAWWIHYQLFNNGLGNFQSVSELLCQMPTKMFNYGLPDGISKAGWYVAHIINAKDGQTNYDSWGKAELAKRMVRNIHPCNYFYFPKTGEKNKNKYGEDPIVISYFREKYARKYKDIWFEFLELIGDVDDYPTSGQSEYQVKIPLIDPNKMIVQADFNRLTSGNSSGIKCEYSHSRLCFLADKIEPLGMDDKFQINSRVGTFVMTKREFYETFSNVVQTTSYQRDRVYHYSSVPQKALRFKV